MVIAGIALLLGWETMALAVFIFSIIAAFCLRRSQPRPPHPLSWLGQIQLLALCWLHPIVREGARLHGMITLGARPSWHPTLREVFEPSKPRRISIPLGEWAFWSENGATRETLLRDLIEVLKVSGHEAQTDTGWRRFDLEIPALSRITCTIQTVTEYHGKGRALTRIKCHVRLQRLLATVFAGLIVLKSLKMFAGRWHEMFWPMIIAFLYGYLRITLKRYIIKAATHSGMKPA